MHTRARFYLFLFFPTLKMITRHLTQVSPIQPPPRRAPRESRQQEKLMGELQRLTDYTNQRLQNMVLQKKVKAAVREK
jgi:hypothetical protein